VAASAALLETLPAPSANLVDMLYRELKDILGITVAQQMESSLQRQAEVSIPIPPCSKAGQQKAAMEPLMVGTTSSPARILAHSNRHPEPQAHYQGHLGDKDA
jgi:hypothetical protein